MKKLTTADDLVRSNCENAVLQIAEGFVSLKHKSKQFSVNNTDIFLPSANEVCEGYVFTRVCHSVHGGGCLGPDPGGRLGGLAGCVCPGPYPGGRLGGLASGDPGPCLGGGVQAQAWGSWGCIPACIEADTPPPQMATAADGTHPTGMHSCLKQKFISRRNNLDSSLCWQFTP